MRRNILTCALCILSMVMSCKHIGKEAAYARGKEMGICVMQGIMLGVPSKIANEHCECVIDSSGDKIGRSLCDTILKQKIRKYRENMPRGL